MKRMITAAGVAPARYHDSTMSDDDARREKIGYLSDRDIRALLQC